MSLFKLLLFTISFLLAFTSGASEKFYTWQAEDGSTVYSDLPPASKELSAEELNMPKPVPAQLPKIRAKESGGLAKQRLFQRKKLLQELNMANEELEFLMEAYQKGKAPKEGERQRLAGGRSKLAQSYFERLKREELQIDQLKQKILKLREKLQVLR